MEKKYKLGGKHPTRNLYRIIAIGDFSDVKAGDIGGWVESESNLSHEGDCWIYNESEIYGEAKVYGNAKISGDSEVYESSSVNGNVCIDSTVIYRHSIIRGSANITDSEIVESVIDGATTITRAFLAGCIVRKNAKVIDSTIHGLLFITGQANIVKKKIDMSFSDEKDMIITAGDKLQAYFPEDELF